MARWKRVVEVLVCAAWGTFLVACSTPYAPHGITGGFTDKRLGPDLYAIEFRGNGNTPADLVLDMYLYRCAELTLQNGFDVFVSRKPEGQAEIRSSQSLALLADTDPEGLMNYRSGGSSYTTVYLPGHTVTSYGISGQVRMGRYADVLPTQEVWDARAVMKTLEPFVKNNRTPALKLEEVAQVGVVHGRGQPPGNDTRTTLDDLSGLLGQH